ncbi:MAG TPA: alginate lyase family protein [Pyrinomonadaceae bacterium]|jgi:hypothetical protein|nr:alginate lyase family protein [Pyrinomonadaceae bacterium]
MSIITKIKRTVRGEVKPKTVLLEALRRTRLSRRSRRERASLDQVNLELPSLWLDQSEDLLAHFRNRTEPRLFSGFSSDSIGHLYRDLFPKETEELLNAAQQIVDEHRWPLLGFGLKSFGEQIEWCRDPLSGYVWPLDYHRDIQLIRNDGSDVRVLWEINRLGHLLTVACAYAVVRDERFSEACFKQLQSWVQQNPYGRGINWTCAMEVALRSMNLLAVFELLKNSPHFTTDTLSLFLKLFHQHGTYISDNLEFSHIATSNHYLSDLAGLLWLGIMLPEFRDSESWCDFASMELLREMDKQVLPDGADFESSTGYHRLVLELFVYSFILCKENDEEIPIKYWDKLQQMFRYMRGFMRPDGWAPLIGDSDGGQVFPICRRRADELAHVLAVGAATFNDPKLRPQSVDAPPELLWLLGKDGLETLRNLPSTDNSGSQAFPHAGTYIMRKDDLYLCLNASGAGLNGRGSHGHNDALSIEVSVGGQAFIVDPGTFVYTADLNQRHLFRSTAYHSTVQVDGEEHNSTNKAVPFVIGDEAHPRVLEWQTNDDEDKIVAEHSGYARLPSPVIHRRTIVFNKIERSWLIEDEFFTEGDHVYEVRFHFAPDLELEVSGPTVTAKVGNVGLRVLSLDVAASPLLETQATSRDYGEKMDSITACWHVSGRPGKLRWKIELLTG